MKYRIRSEDAIIDAKSEWSFLNTMLDDKHTDYVNRASPLLFTEERRKIFVAMQKAYGQYGQLSFDGISFYLGKDVPGELMGAQPTNPRAALDNLVRLAKKRELIEVKDKIGALEEEYNPSDADIFNALTVRPLMAEEDSSLASGSRIMLGELHAKSDGTYKYADTGLTFLNSKMGGEWKPKSLVLLNAAPGSGKTALAGQSMLAMATIVDEATGENLEVPSIMFSLEMTKEDLLKRWIATHLNFDYGKLISGKLTPEELKIIEDAAVHIQSLPMYVIDKSDITVPQIMYELKKHKTQFGVRVAFIDYLQILNHAPTGNTNKDLGDAVKLLKNFAKRENMTIVVLSQITPGKDGVFSTRDSGDVPAVVDVSIIIEPDEEQAGSAAKNIIMRWVKNRFGPTRDTPLLFDGVHQKFIGATE